MWKSLKQILRDSKDKVVIMEEGEAKYVILSIEEYMRLREETSPKEESLDVVDRQSIARDTKESPAPLEVTPPPSAQTAAFDEAGAKPFSSGQGDDSSEINLEDLPF